MQSTKQHYEPKAIQYGIGHTRLRKTLELVGYISGKRVLDVGCATGYLGTKIKEKENTVVGIDISQSAITRAKDVLDDAICVDTEQQWPILPHSPYDLIIMSEIVEHVFDPVQVLKQALRNLTDDGQIIITTPNFMKWTHRLKFLFGNFAYTDQGALDFGHIRLFTYKYLHQLVKDSGCKVVKENHIIFPSKLTCFLKFWPSLFASQFIVKIKRNV